MTEIRDDLPAADAEAARFSWMRGALDLQLLRLLRKLVDRFRAGSMRLARAAFPSLCEEAPLNALVRAVCQGRIEGLGAQDGLATD